MAKPSKAHPDGLLNDYLKAANDRHMRVAKRTKLNIIEILKYRYDTIPTTKLNSVIETSQEN